MRLRYNKEDTSLACYINNETRNLSICINDVVRLKLFLLNMDVNEVKELTKNEMYTNYLRVYLRTYDSLTGTKIEEIKTFVEKVEYSNRMSPVAPNEYVFSIQVTEDSVFNIYIKHYVERRIIQEFSNDLQIEHVNIINTGNQNHVYFDLSEELKYVESLDDKTYEFLNNWKSYYEEQLEEISNQEESVVATVLLDEFRKNIEFWNNIRDNNIIYFPVKCLEKNTNLSSTSLISTSADDKNEEWLKEYNGVKFKILSKTNAQDFFEKAVENYDYNITCEVGYIENDEGIRVNINKFLDRNIIKLEIKRNIIGEIIRVKRIIQGIKSVSSLDVMNNELIEQVINNDLVDDNSYILDKEKIENLKNEYSINDEQAIIVDKILNMDDLFLVQGPPGTGKTTIISTVVKELDKQGKRVLLTSNVREARLNIIERIKGEKELIIKEYTDLKPESEKHKQEVKNNKLRYIENQIIEKFSFDNVRISTPEEYEKLIVQKKFYEDCLKEIELLVTEKKKIEKQKADQIKEIEILKQEIEKITFKNKEQIYDLIITNKLDNITQENIGNDVDKFLEIYENSNMSNVVEKLMYHQDVISKLSAQTSLTDKIELYQNINSDLLINTNDVLKSSFINEYSSMNKLKKWLFNLSNFLKIFRIDNINKKEAIMLCDECDAALNYIDKNIIEDSYAQIVNDFVSYLEEKILLIEKNIESYEYIINAKEIEIADMSNKHFNKEVKLKEISKFIANFDLVKNEYQNEELFYDYLKTLSKITNLETDNEYVEHMLSRKYFSNIFECYSNDGGNILCMSTNQVAKFLENDYEGFDYIIVDEASKCNFNDLIISLSRTNKLVLIGDYLQLDPVVEEKTSELLTDEQWKHIQLSNFSQLIKPILDTNFNKNIDYNKSNSIGILKQQYRMSKQIYEIISKIYDSIDGFHIENSKLLNPYEHHHNVLAVQCDGVESMRTEDETSRYNEIEINKIFEIVKDIVELAAEGKLENIKKIGIISFYKLQAKRIANMLSQLKKELQKHSIEVQIGTVDNFQGREFDLVLVSCVRTELTKPFLTEIRRWNVSISRAKEKLIVLGNFNKLYENSRYKKIDPKLSQENKEMSVIYNEIIPMLNEMSENTQFINGGIKEFIVRGIE